MIVRRCCRRRGLLFRDQKLRRRKCTTQALLLPDISPSLSAAVTLCFPQLLLHIKAIYMLIHIDFSNHIIGLHFDLLWHAFAQVLILHAEPQQSFKGVADDTKEASQVLATWAVCNYVSASVFWRECECVLAMRKVSTGRLL